MSETRLKEIYSWQAAYNAAILETDNAAMPLRIYEALAAVEQRFLSPIEQNGEEDRAIQAAQTGLAGLKSERTDTFETCNSISDEGIEQIHERLRKMSDPELRQFGRAARDLSNPKKNFGPPNPSFQIQLDEARAEWRRRHPK